MIGRIRARSARAVSSTLAIGTASLFVAVAALIGLALDRPPPFAASWSLRGTIAPASDAPALPATSPRRARGGDHLEYA